MIVFGAPKTDTIYDEIRRRIEAARQRDVSGVDGSAVGSFVGGLLVGAASIAGFVFGRWMARR